MAEALRSITALIEPPVVGHRYLVPTVRYTLLGITTMWPVRGPAHDDVEYLGFSARHRHLDGCFLAGRAARPLISAYRDVSRRRGFGNRDEDALAFAVASRPLAESPLYGPLPSPTLKPLICRDSGIAYPRRRATRSAPAP